MDERHPARTKDDDVPVIGDYSEAADARLRADAEQAAAQRGPAQRVAAEDVAPARGQARMETRGTSTRRLPSEWALDPSDVRRHAALKRQSERPSPLAKIARWSAVAVVLVAAFAAWRNFDTLRGVRLDYSAFTSLFDRPTDGLAKPDPAGESGSGDVAAPVVAGEKVPASVGPKPPSEPEQARERAPERAPAPVQAREPAGEPPAAAGDAAREQTAEVPQREAAIAPGLPATAGGDDATASDAKAPATTSDAATSATATADSSETEAPSAPSADDDAATRVATAPPPAAPEPPPEPESFEFGLSVTHVSEAAPSANILILRNGDRRHASSITWWTEDGTAKAGSDYINLGMIAQRFAAGEQNHTIHIPIVGDHTVEGPEDFYVLLSPSGGADPSDVRKLEVIIDDDD